MSTAQTIAGEYFLTGVHETAAGFLIKDDSTFEYFYSEGALDRYEKRESGIRIQKSETA
jgi:hypothetical protein